MQESGKTLIIVSGKVRRSTRACLQNPPRQTSVAAAKKLRDWGIIGHDDTVVCNLTGHGLKQPEAIQFSEKEFASIAPTIEALREQVKQIV